MKGKCRDYLYAPHRSVAIIWLRVRPLSRPREMPGTYRPQCATLKFVAPLAKRSPVNLSESLTNHTPPSLRVQPTSNRLPNRSVLDDCRRMGLPRTDYFRGQASTPARTLAASGDMIRPHQQNFSMLQSEEIGVVGRGETLDVLIQIKQYGNEGSADFPSVRRSERVYGRDGKMSRLFRKFLFHRKTMEQDIIQVSVLTEL